MITLKSKFKEKAPSVGVLASLGSVEAVELLSHSGPDYIWIDAEHSAIGVREVQSMLQAIGGRCNTVVRVPCNDEAWIKKVLDAGCDGIIVPQINSAEEAQKAVQLCYYPPRGRRSVGATRAQAYGYKSSEYFNSAYDKTAVILQVEHIDGVNAIDEIIAVCGIDVIFIGPIDLSASLGVMGQVGHPEVEAAIDKVRSACRRLNMPTGIYCRDAESVSKAKSAGDVMIAYGSDAGFLRGAVVQALASARS